MERLSCLIMVCVIWNVYKVQNLLNMVYLSRLVLPFPIYMVADNNMRCKKGLERLIWCTNNFIGNTKNNICSQCFDTWGSILYFDYTQKYMLANRRGRYLNIWSLCDHSYVGNDIFFFSRRSVYNLMLHCKQSLIQLK